MTIDQLQLYTATGGYLPSFFKMAVRSGESFLDVQSLSENTASTYFHEYMHYIQDVSTFHGLSNIIRMGEYLHYCKKLIENGSTVFKVPIPDDLIDSGVNISAKIGHILNGSMHNISHSVQIEEINVRQTGVISSDGTDIPEVVITYNDGQEYLFGALAVNESMAYIGEKELFPASPLAPTFPYHSAELIARFIFPEFAGKKLNIFALCDVALMSAEPGPTYYKHLLKLKASGFEPYDPKDVYEFFKNEIFEYQDWKLNRIQMLSTLGQIARIYLKGYFPVEAYEANVTWMDHIIDHAVSLRNRNISFPLDIILHGSFYDNPELDLTMKNIGGPLQLNENAHATFIIIEQLADKMIQPDLNWVISDILKVILGSTRPCGMKDFCKASATNQGLPDYTNSLCDINPWFRAYNDIDCSMTRVLKMWKLDKKIPRNNLHDPTGTT